MKKFTCSLCKNLLPNKKELIAHIKDMHGKVKTYSCRNCDDVYPSKITLVRHTKKFHSALAKNRLSKKGKISKNKENEEDMTIIGEPTNVNEKNWEDFQRRKNMEKTKKSAKSIKMLTNEAKVNSTGKNVF